MDKDNKKKVLYIEDDPEMIDLVNLILNRKGYSVNGICGGRPGLDSLKQESPDLILLDLMMPDMDGWEVYQQLKANNETKNIPVIVITAKSQPIDKVLGLHIAKVDDYICKPFHPDELLRSIEQIFSRKTEKTT